MTSRKRAMLVLLTRSNYPYSYYPPEHHITYLSPSFPEHHMPLHETRHKLGQSLHNLWQDSWPQPRADVRETLQNFYIDVECPGIGSEDQIQLKWTNSRTLYAQLELKPRQLPEEEEDALKHQKATQESQPLFDAEHATKARTGGSPLENDHKQHITHQVVKERQLGKLKRAFYFYVDVDRGAMTARLRHGVLEITIPKNDDQHAQEQHTVQVMPHPETTAAAKPT